MHRIKKRTTLLLIQLLKTINFAFMKKKSFQAKNSAQMGFVVFQNWNLPPILPKKVKMFQNERFVLIIKKTKTMVICRLIFRIFVDFQNFQISRFQIPENMEIL